MLASPAIFTFFEAIGGTPAHRPALDRITGRTGFLPRRRSVSDACLELYASDDATMNDLGITRQQVLRLMSHQFGR
jgi:uncharacterized protein YjiS (DUF1127 family)